MILKAYKPVLLIAVFLAVNAVSIAQSAAVSVSVSPDVSVSVNTRVDDKDFEAQLNDFTNNLKADLKDLGKNLSLSFNNMSPKISVQLRDLAKDLHIDIDPKINISVDNPDGNSETSGNNESSAAKEKFKSYSKSYPVDANDQIRLSNQFGKITVTTWDRHEVKVDVQIKAESNSDDDAQKLLDGVQISDSKNGDQVSFRTDIQHNNSSWKLWNNNNKVRKVTINYTVYMPAKTDLNVEQSFGGIVLPDLDGRVKISSSYGSVAVQKLTNPANDIEGSYGSLKMGSMNGGRLEFSYGSVDMDDCNNIKADLSYGSFKLGRLRGSADLNLSNVGGFRIGEIAPSFKRLNINSSYSAVALGVSDNNNFDFDITTTYGGFSYNDGKVTITSKTPADGSRYYSNTKNYKGHFGRGSEAQIIIRSSYGGVNFE